MGLSRLDNFLKSVRGTVVYVDPGSLDATDSIENQGNSLARPFKTIQRALVEASRFSYQKGLDNDRFDKTTLVLYPGNHTIDNRPGWIPIAANNYRLRDGTTSGDFGAWDLTTNFDLTSDTNQLYKLNSIYGGVIVPRGVSIVGIDPRKTKIRPKYVPNPENSNIERSAIFRLTGGCYISQFGIQDADPNGVCFKDYTTNKFVPNFSHNKLTCFEYADGVNNVDIDDDFISGSDGEFTRTDLDMYYEKVGIAYGPSSGREIEPDWPSSGLDIQPKIDEYRIVGSKGAEVGITSIRAGDGTTSSTTVTVTLETAGTAFDVDTPIRISNASSEYNGQFVVASKVDSTNITYTLQNAPVDPSPSITNAKINVSVDTVTSTSPYVFNCTLRSVYGMCGLFADGNKATGFKSMVLAQFTGIGLQKDNNAFVKYNETSGTYEDGSVSGNSDLQADSNARFKPSYANYHIKASNNAVLQLASIFAIGFAHHFTTEEGGDMSITNSNSNFGANAFKSVGFRTESFARDDVGYISHIIPPKVNDNTEIGAEFTALDVNKIVAIGVTNKLYLYNETNEDVAPESVIEGYRIGARENDKLNVVMSNSGITTTHSARIIMPSTQFTSDEVSAVKKFDVGNTSVGVNSVSSNTFTLTSDHNLINGETIRVISENGHLPDGLKNNTVYYAITSGVNADQIKIAKTLNDAQDGSAVTVNTNGGLLNIESRVSDKKSGDIGHPIQYDSTHSHWYVNVATGATENTLYHTIIGIGSTSLGNATARTFIKRKPETRSLEDTVYRARYVLPSASSVDARPPLEGFVIQESNASIGSTDGEVGYLYNPDSQTLTNSTELRNPRYIADTFWSSSTASVVTEIPHDLKAGATVEILNVKSSNNTTGGANSGYNGTFTVAGITSATQFTVSLSDDPGTFTSDTADRTTSLPNFKPKKTSGTYYVYRSEEVQEYVKGKQDGIYHLLMVNSSNAPTVSPFTGSAYSQSVQSLYPQTNRDNPSSDPKSSSSFAIPKVVGEVVVNEPQNSITRESLEDRIIDVRASCGFGLTDIVSGSSGTTHVLYTDIEHGLNRISRIGIQSAGVNYANGNYYNIPLVGVGGSTVGKNATARVTVSSNAVSDVEIIYGGSAYEKNDWLHLSGITTTGQIDAIIKVEEIYSNIGDTLKISGVTPDSNDGYNTVYKIDAVGVGSNKEISVSSASTISSPSTTGIGATNAGTGYVSLTGQGLNGDGSVLYDRRAGLVTVTTYEAHGLNVNDKIRLGGLNDNVLNGDAVISEVVGLTSFVANIGISTFTPSTDGNPRVYKLGFVAKGGNVLRENEDKGRLITEYAGITTLTSAAVTNTATSITIANASNYDFKIGDYLQIDYEIVRIKTGLTTSVGNQAVTVFRGLMGTNASAHDSGVVIRKIKPRPIELRRNSIIRASGHTFEYVGYGPGNYSTALPEKQNRNIGEQEQLLSQSIKSSGGSVIFTAMNQDGDFFTGNKKVNSATGQEKTFDAPIPTVTGEDLGVGGVNVGFDVLTPLEATISRSIKVEGGPDGNIISKFDGPVILNNKLTSTSSKGIEANSLFLQGDRTVSRKYTVGIATPTTSGNIGDVVYNANAAGNGMIGWVYTTDNQWETFGRVGLNGADPGNSVAVSVASSYVGFATQLNFVGAGVTVSTGSTVGSGNTVTINFDSTPRMGISTGAASGTNNLLGIGTQINFVGYGLTVTGEFESTSGIATIILTANTAGSSSTTSPQGSTNSVQYNNSGFFGGGSGFTYDGSNVAITGSTSSPLTEITQSGSGAGLHVSGTVGVGTTNTSGAKIDVLTTSAEALRLRSNASSGNILRVDSGAIDGNDTNPTIIDWKGNLGVNTVTTNAELDVLGDVSITGIVSFYNNDRNLYTSIGPSTITSNVTFYLPNQVGVANSLLYTTGSGQLDWLPQSGIVTAALPNTDSLTEGSTNLYFTNERAQDAIDSAISSGVQTGITVTYSDTGNSLSFNVETSPYPFSTKGFSLPI